MNFKILLHTLIQQVFFECLFYAGPCIDSRGVLTIYYFKKNGYCDIFSMQTLKTIYVRYNMGT